MKPKLPLLLWLLCAALAGRAQPATPYVQLTKLVQPPGVVWVQDSLWMDEAEIANLHYLEYLHFLRLDSTEAHFLAAFPDTAVWGQRNTYNPYITYYLRYPGFRYYPVVGISYRQAVRYCRWRSAMVNKNLHSAEYLKKHPQLRGYNFRVEYRLPTVREWELAAGGAAVAGLAYGDVFPPVEGSRRYKEEMVPKLAKLAEALPACLPVQVAAKARKPIFRLPFTVQEKLYGDDIRQAFTCAGLDSLEVYKLTGRVYVKEGITAYCYSNPPNLHGCYNLIGNVAELTATPGVAKGGSFWHSINDSAIPTNLSYTRPQMWLGFRCACTVYIEPKP